jgi:hypothetical protein
MTQKIKKNKIKNKTKNKKIKQNGGTNVIQATIGLINSMKDLGESIFTEMKSMTHLSSDLNNATTQNVPVNNISGPTSANTPKL